MISILTAILSAFLATPTHASEKQSVPKAWPLSMQALAKSLADAFPFFYSQQEFRNPDNKEAVLKHLGRLIKGLHELSEKQGQAFLGAEPLIKAAKTQVKGDLTRARDLYTAKKYDRAQTTLHGALQKCFACHTAHPGPKSAETNSEVANMATPFPRSKPVVFGALRQFDGALAWIEAQSGPARAELGKLHLLISLRALQDFSRAEKFLNVLVEQSKQESAYVKLLDGWHHDIRHWREHPEQPPAGRSQFREADFIAALQETLVLHRKTAASGMDPAEKARTFQRLGALYKEMGVAELADLSRIYWKACVEVKGAPAAVVAGCR